MRASFPIPLLLLFAVNCGADGPTAAPLSHRGGKADGIPAGTPCSLDPTKKKWAGAPELCALGEEHYIDSRGLPGTADQWCGDWPLIGTAEHSSDQGFFDASVSCYRETTSRLGSCAPGRHVCFRDRRVDGVVVIDPATSAPERECFDAHWDCVSPAIYKGLFGECQVDLGCLVKHGAEDT